MFVAGRWRPARTSHQAANAILHEVFFGRVAFGLEDANRRKRLEGAADLFRLGGESPQAGRKSRWCRRWWRNRRRRDRSGLRIRRRRGIETDDNLLLHGRRDRRRHGNGAAALLAPPRAAGEFVSDGKRLSAIVAGELNHVVSCSRVERLASRKGFQVMAAELHGR